jgi:uncharacterized membrane protein YqaE (UPF0057 family)
MKKILFTLLIAFGFAQLMPVQATTAAEHTGQAVLAKLLEQQNNLPASLRNMTPEEFLDLTPKKIKAATGKKLKLKEVVMLKAAQKAVKKQLKSGGSAAPGIEKGVYIILAIFIPFLAVGLASDWEGNDWLICLVLSLLCWLPGFIYALVKMKDYYPS